MASRPPRLRLAASVAASVVASVAAAVCVTLSAVAVDLHAQSRAQRVEATPMRAVAATTAEGDVRFSSAAWATRLASGDIAIADLADASLRILSADGRTTRTVGRRGSGPGEYQLPLWVGRCGGDSLVVWDAAVARMTIHAPQPTAAATPSTRSFADAAGSLYATCGATGAIAIATQMGPRRDMPPIVRGQTAQGGEYSVVTMGTTMRTYEQSGTARYALPPMVFSEFISGRASSSSGYSGAPRPLGALTSFAFVGDRLVIASADSGSVVGYGPDGREAFRFSVPRTARTVTPDDYANAIDPALAMLPARARDAMSAFVAMVPPPPSAPPFWRVLGDPTGLIWLVVTPEGASRTVLRSYTTTGAMIAEHALAGTIVPFEVGRDYVLGRRENADGEQEIVVFRVVRD